MERQRGLHSKIGFHAESCIDWHSLKSAVKKQTTGMKTMITKYIHGCKVPKGNLFTMGRTPAHNESAKKPMNTSSYAEVPKHGIKAMGIRLSAMANAIQKTRTRTKVTPVWLD